MRQERNLRAGIGKIREFFGFMFLLPTNLILIIRVSQKIIRNLTF